MNKLTERCKSLLNKDITAFLKNHKIPFISALVLILLTFASLIVTYAFYQTIDIKRIVGGTVGELADLNINIFIEDRDSAGNGNGKYIENAYIPKAGYTFNSEMSKCAKGSSIEYNANTYEAKINSIGPDTCNLYFDASGNLDITLNIMLQDVNDEGTPLDTYTKLTSREIPIGYKFNSGTSGCVNGSTIAYDQLENMIVIEASGKDTCTAYMDALQADIALKLFVQENAGDAIEQYKEVQSIPTNKYYTLNASSACTGSGSPTISLLQNQKISIQANNKTSCVAYLDLASGPALQSIDSSSDGTTLTVSLNKVADATAAVKYYFSIDGGNTYEESTTNSKSYTGLTTGETYNISAYYVDATGLSSAILKKAVLYE